MKTNKKGATGTEILVIITTLIILIGVIIIPIFLVTMGYGNQTITEETINEATIEMKGMGSTLSREKYVYTDKSTYKVQDRFWSGHFNSMDVFREAKNCEGKVSQITSVGTRLGFLDMFKTIKKVECDETKQTEELK